MFSQDDIDAVLQQAEDAVTDLANDVGESAPNPPAAAPAPQPAPEPTASSPKSNSHAATAKPGGASLKKQKLKRILGLQVPVIVRLASRSMAVNEIMKMGPGTILEFDRTVDQELDLMINNCVIGGGVAVKVNEHFGLRINRVHDLQKRIDSLGASS